MTSVCPGCSRAGPLPLEETDMSCVVRVLVAATLSMSLVPNALADLVDVFHEGHGLSLGVALGTNDVAYLGNGSFFQVQSRAER